MTNHQPADGVGDTVGGRNSAPVDMANNPLFTGFYIYTSQVVQVFFHQQYGSFWKVRDKSPSQKANLHTSIYSFIIVVSCNYQLYNHSKSVQSQSSSQQIMLVISYCR